MTSATIQLAQALIREDSVSPEDGQCQAIMAEYLERLGFSVEHMPFGPVSNFWAVRQGKTPGHLLAFAGHTDVVPPGPLENWHIPPFEGVVENDYLEGRGAADMKGSLAAMLTAIERFINENEYSGSIGLLITSDEEDVAADGTVKVMDELDRRNVKIDYCVIGEPSSSNQVGDVIRVGRRGSLNGRLIVKGVQGHVAYPKDAVNPIHLAAPALAELAAAHWDDGNEFFPATSFQISNINAGTGANNVVPGELSLDFNFRFSTESTEASLREKTETILARHLTEYEVIWKLSGPPFLTTGGELIPATCKAIQQVTGIDTELSTSGGTSDGRFIAPRGVEVVELGPTNATIHKVNERIPVEELNQLSVIYESILKELLVK